MAAVYPGSLASIPNAAADDTPGNAAGVGLAALLVQLADELEAVQAKVGIDASGVTTSIDYLLKSLSSLDPGHVHSGAFQCTDTDVTVDANVVGTTETALRSFTLPANSLRVGDVIRVRVCGTGDRTSIGAPNLTFRLRWGGVSGTILAATAALAPPSATITNDLWEFSSDIHVRAIGASGSMFPQSVIRAIAGTSVLGSASLFSMPASGTSPDGTTSAVTVATDVSKVLVLTAQWGGATAGNVIRSSVGSAEVIRKAA